MLRLRRRRARRDQVGFDLRLKAARQFEPAGAKWKVHPRQAGVEPGTQKIVWITAHRIVLVEQRPHPCAQVLGNRLLVDAHRNPAALPSS